MPLKIDDNEILEDLRRVYQEHGVFSQKQYIKYGKYGKNTLVYKFGSFSKALHLAGIPQKERGGWTKYTNEELLEEIKRYVQEFGEVPRLEEISECKGYPSSMSYRNLFPGKTWSEILKFAGFKSRQKTTSKAISRVKIIEDIKNTARILNKNSLSVEDYQLYGHYSVGPLIRIFGSVLNAFSEAGLDKYKRIFIQFISKEELISDIKLVAKNINKSAMSWSLYTNNGGKFSLTTVRKHFKNSRELIKSAGLEIEIRRKFFSKEEIIQDIQWVAQLLNKKHISFSEYKKLGKFNQANIINKFDSVRDAFIKAGVLRIKSVNKVKEVISKNDIIIDMIETAKKLNHSLYLGRNEYEKYGKFSIKQIKKYFDNWEIARNIAKLNAIPLKKKYSKEQLLIYLKKFYCEFNFVPTKRDIEQTKNYPSDKVYYATFPNKSWAAILELAGLKSENQIKGLDGHFYDSVAEMKIANLLYSNFIKYEPHKKICANRNWKCDFYLPETNSWIEFDGLENRRLKPEKYQEKIKYYKDNSMNLIELKDGENLIEKANLFLFGNIIIDQVTYNDANNFLKRTHYLRKAPSNSKHFGAYINGILVGVVSVGNSANPMEKNLCITRIAWLDRVRYDRNFGSRFIAAVLKQIKLSGYRGKIVSWSDPRYHSGTLYKACNFKQITPKKNRQDYVYIDKDGNEFHKSYCRVRAGESESEYAKKLGLTKIKVQAKIKWVYEL